MRRRWVGVGGVLVLVGTVAAPVGVSAISAGPAGSKRLARHAAASHAAASHAGRLAIK
jgi:hypothetical protein